MTVPRDWRWQNAPCPTTTRRPRVRCLPAPSRPRPERDDPALGWCAFCQRTHVAAYRPPAWWFGLGRWRCARCGASGPGVDARLPLAEWAAFHEAMRVQPRVVRGAKGRFETVAPFGAESGGNGP